MQSYCIMLINDSNGLSVLETFYNIIKNYKYLFYVSCCIELCNMSKYQN